VELLFKFSLHNIEILLMILMKHIIDIIIHIIKILMEHDVTYFFYDFYLIQYVVNSKTLNNPIQVNICGMLAGETIY